MGALPWFILVVGVLAGLYLGGFLSEDPVKPKIVDGWWGRNLKFADDPTIRKFKVNVPEEDLTDLYRRLNSTRLGEDLPDTKFRYGFRVDHMKQIMAYWSDKYDWRKQERLLNSYPQFKTQIEGIDVHFMRILPHSGKATRQLLVVHGWPSTIWEFHKFIPILVDPRKYGGLEEDAFEVICPSIPGYGYSEAPHQSGFGPTDVARVFVKLMDRLGHTKFYFHGGDWGGVIGTHMAQAFPERVLGAHLVSGFPVTDTLTTWIKQFVGSRFPWILGISDQEHKNYFPMSDRLSFLLMETGYYHLQATKPDTAAFALTDSPVGLAAYILEKFSSWTNPDYRDLPDGGLTQKYSLDELLTTVMIYWFNANIGSSMRLYKERFADPDTASWNPIPIDIPVGIASMPQDLLPFPRALLTSRYRNIVQFSIMPRGGHFATLEEPELLARDLWMFVRNVETGDI